MNPDIIHDAIAHGRISEEKGARLLEIHYGLVRVAKRARFKRWLRRVLTLGWWR